MNLVHIGYDIRKWPQNGCLTTDGMEWAPETELFERAKTELGLAQNVFQLLEAPTNAAVERLAELVDFGRAASLVSFEAFKPVVDAYCGRAGWPVTESVWGRFEWTELGYDVCDVNGLFSALHMDIPQVKSANLFLESQWEEVLAVAQVAGIVAPEHAPFVVIKLRRLST